MRRILAGLVIVLLTPTWGLANTRNEIVRLQNDVLQLQNQIRLLQKSIDDNQGIVQSLLEQLNDQMAKNNLSMQGLVQGLQTQRADSGTALDQLRQEIQNLSLKFDDTNTRIAAIQRQLEENQMRVRTLRSPVALGGDPSGDPEQLYSAAYNDYLMGNLDLAIESFQDFLIHFPENDYASSASYYLGVCYFDLGRFEQAVQAFDQVINLYSTSDKVPVAFYKKGVALEQQQRNAEAIEAFRRLSQLFPDSQEALLARQQLQRLGVEDGRTPRRR